MDTKIYIYRIEKEYIEEHLDEIASALPEWRRKKIEKLRRIDSKVVSAAAGSLLYHVLDKEYGINPEELDIKEGTKGKPESDKLFFNISHSGEYIALAVSDKNIGVDIEYKDDRGGRIAKRFFTEEEIRFISEEGLGEESIKGDSGMVGYAADAESAERVDGGAETQKRFRKIWTMKESCIKLLGAGLSIPLNKIPVDPIECTADVSGFPEYKMDKVHFMCFDFTGEDEKGYSVSVCTENILKNAVKYIQYYGCIFSE